MKWSAVLVAASMGTRTGAVQVAPPAEWLRTMSFDAQCARKRQSSQATYVVPAASISALGSGLVRRPPATLWKRTLATSTPFVQEAPPSWDEKASILPLRLSKG